MTVWRNRVLTQKYQVISVVRSKFHKWPKISQTVKKLGSFVISVHQLSFSWRLSVLLVLSFKQGFFKKQGLVNTISVCSDIPAFHDFIFMPAKQELLVHLLLLNQCKTKKGFSFFVFFVAKWQSVASGDYISATQLMLIAHSLSRPVPVWFSAELPLLSQAVHNI